eukprot:TRINITY_DN4577_c0_g1_i5.p1 TRINITY_DN4577_c0_g1~~TRINITY_DN4577_c0_g1_i5.p1  ORF type:complete len:555 (-),score=99.58 TRINITY_DN4577_c0_g1_i5:24-1595(-)
MSKKKSFTKTNKATNVNKNETNTKTGASQANKSSNKGARVQHTTKKDTNNNSTNFTKQTGKRKRSATQQLSKNEEKKLKKQKKLSKGINEVVHEAKLLWEKARIDPKQKTPERYDVMVKIMELLKGKLKKVATMPDGSRILQTMLKLGLPIQRKAVFEEVKGSIIDLSKTKHGRYFVKKLLKYSTKAQREFILKKFNGQVRGLLLIKYSAFVIEYFYNTIASHKQRLSLLEELYGNEYGLFKVENRTWDSIITENPAKKQMMLEFLQKYIFLVTNKGPSLLSHSINHAALLTYFTNAEVADIKVAIAAIRDHFLHMIHTKNGAHVGCICFDYASPKDKKFIIKSWKTFVYKIAIEEFGHIVFLKALTCVDDTKLLERSLFTEMNPKAKQICCNKYGRTIYLLLLVPDQIHRYVKKKKSEWLNQATASTSKKDPEVRRKELLQIAKPQMIQACKEHTYRLATNEYGYEVMLHCLLWLKEEDKEAHNQILTNLLNYIDPRVEEYESSEEESEVDTKDTNLSLIHI